jgi:hypothetical protein
VSTAMYLITLICWLSARHLARHDADAHISWCHFDIVNFDFHGAAFSCCLLPRQSPVSLVGVHRVTMSSIKGFDVLNTIVHSA